MNSTTDYGTYLTCFSAGAIAGAAVALLLAPHSGRKTRRMLQSKLEDGAEAVSDAGAEFLEASKRACEKAASVTGMTG